MKARNTCLVPLLAAFAGLAIAVQPGLAAQMPFDFDHVRAQMKVASADPLRPRFHFVPPAKGMIDVWGGMRFRDAYRLFYDLNLTAERRMGGSFMQLETRDFIRWTHLPPA